MLNLARNLTIFHIIFFTTMLQKRYLAHSIARSQTTSTIVVLVNYYFIGVPSAFHFILISLVLILMTIRIVFQILDYNFIWFLNFVYNYLFLFVGILTLFCSILYYYTIIVTFLIKVTLFKKKFKKKSWFTAYKVRLLI